MTYVVNYKKITGFDFLVDRRTPWGNPWSDHAGTAASFIVASRAEAIRNYADWLQGKAFNDFEPDGRLWIIRNLSSIKNKTIACACAPKACHAEILAQLADHDATVESIGEIVLALPGVQPAVPTPIILPHLF